MLCSDATVLVLAGENGCKIGEAGWDRSQTVRPAGQATKLHASRMGHNGRTIAITIFPFVYTYALFVSL